MKGRRVGVYILKEYVYICIHILLYTNGLVIYTSWTRRQKQEVQNPSAFIYNRPKTVKEINIIIMLPLLGP